MNNEFTQYTPISVALGSSYQDLGGTGQQPANLMQGLALNGMSQNMAPVPQMRDKGFDAVLKAPALPEPPSVTAPKVEPPVIKPPSVAQRKPGG